MKIILAVLCLGMEGCQYKVSLENIESSNKIVDCVRKNGIPMTNGQNDIFYDHCAYKEGGPNAR